MLGPLRTGEAAQIVGFCLGEKGWCQDGGSLVGAKAVAGDPLVPDAGLLNERDTGLFVVDRASADVPADQRRAQIGGQRDAIRAFAIGVTGDEPHAGSLPKPFSKKVFVRLTALTRAKAVNSNSLTKALEGSYACTSSIGTDRVTLHRSQ